MSYIDILIPAVVGFLLLISPQTFLVSQSTPDQKKIRLVRASGTILVAVAALYFVIMFVS